MSSSLTFFSIYKVQLILGAGVVLVGGALIGGGGGAPVDEQRSFDTLRDTAVSPAMPATPPIDSVMAGYRPAADYPAQPDFYRSLKEASAPPPQVQAIAPPPADRGSVSALQVIEFPAQATPDAKAVSKPTQLIEIAAQVLRTTQLVNGGNLVIRLLQDVPLPDGQVIPASHVIVAQCAIQGNRIKLTFQRVRTESGSIAHFAGGNVIDYYDLGDNIRREVSLGTLQKEERIRQQKQIASTTLNSISSTVEGQVLPAVTGGLLSNLVRVASQASAYIPEATLPEGYLVLLQISI